MFVNCSQRMCTFHYTKSLGLHASVPCSCSTRDRTTRLMHDEDCNLEKTLWRIFLLSVRCSSRFHSGYDVEDTCDGIDVDLHIRDYAFEILINTAICHEIVLMLFSRLLFSDLLLSILKSIQNPPCEEFKSFTFPHQEMMCFMSLHSENYNY